MKSNFYVDCNNHFLFLKLISTDMVSMLHVEPLLRSLDGMSSRKYNKSPPPFEFLSNLYGVQNPFNLNWAELMFGDITRNV